MKRRYLPKIQMDRKHFPYNWEQNLVSNQKIGGVFLVFLEGKDTKEIDYKVKLIKDFCKTIPAKMKDFITVKPL